MAAEDVPVGDVRELDDGPAGSVISVTEDVEASDEIKPRNEVGLELELELELELDLKLLETLDRC